MTVTGDTPLVLLVEDDDGDAGLVAEALRERDGGVRLHRVADGDAAVAHLGGVGAGREERPTLVVLDLNLPGRSGIEVLQRIKGDSRLMDIPVTVLSTTDDQDTIARVYGLHGNAYITKPLQLDDFLRRVGSLRGFWLESVALPTRA